MLTVATPVLNLKGARYSQIRSIFFAPGAHRGFGTFAKQLAQYSHTYLANNIPRSRRFICKASLHSSARCWTRQECFIPLLLHSFSLLGHNGAVKTFRNKTGPRLTRLGDNNPRSRGSCKTITLGGTDAIVFIVALPVGHERSAVLPLFFNLLRFPDPMGRSEPSAS